nr:PREDICTED: prestin-like isoform X1 [Bemisia tabaci]
MNQDNCKLLMKFSSTTPQVVVSNQNEDTHRRQRPFKQQDFNTVYQYSKLNKTGVLQKISNKGSKCCESPCNLLLSIFPIFQWLPKYNWRSDFSKDVVSGLTVGILHIPQGMAYSSLGGVPPITGLYMAFFPVLLYVLMGTSRHISMGTFAVVCMMTSKPVFKYATFPSSDHTSEDTAGLTPVQVASAVCLIVGIWQILFGIFRLGSLSVLMSETLVSGFTTGAAILVLTSQVKHLFGIPLKTRVGSLKVVYTYRDLFNNIHLTNFWTLGMGLIVASLLYFYQQVIKPRVSKHIPVPIPTELIAIISGTLLSKHLNLPSTYGIKVVGDIPLGLPDPSPPPVWLLPNLVIDGLVIAIVAFSVNISMAFIFARKLKYDVDPNQELIASGCSNIFASFFSCIPFAASLSRSVIQQTVGGKTQLASVVSCSFLILILLFIGPFFEDLPYCVLAAIVLVSMTGLLVQFKDLFTIFGQSKSDGLIWFTTFISVVLLDIDYGLVIGVVISLVCVIIKSQKVIVSILGNIPETDMYVELERYEAAVQVPETMILQLTGGLNFANIDSSVQKIIKKINNFKRFNKVQNVVLNMASVSYIDRVSTIGLLNLTKELKGEGIFMYLASVSDAVGSTLDKCGFFKEFSETYVSPSVHDAILFIQLSSQ